VHDVLELTVAGHGVLLRVAEGGLIAAGSPIYQGFRAVPHRRGPDRRPIWVPRQVFFRQNGPSNPPDIPQAPSKPGGASDFAAPQYQVRRPPRFISFQPVRTIAQLERKGNNYFLSKIVSTLKSRDERIDGAPRQAFEPARRGVVTWSC
jgi:hypothetical protein